MVTSLAGKGIRKGISMFTVCMDRNRMLYKNLPSWIDCDDIEEIIVVDWNSKKQIKIEDPKVKIIRVNNVDWSQTKSFNLASRFCSLSKICKMDCDYYIKKEFFRAHPLRHGEFYAGNWRIARNKNEKYLCGFLYCHRDNFFAVNGYNEFFTTYGYDDSDLKNRLVLKGLSCLDINLDKIKHRWHTNRKRSKKYNQSMSLPDSIEYNKLLAIKNPWSKSNKMTNYHIKKINESFYECQMI